MGAPGRRLPATSEDGMTTAEKEKGGQRKKPRKNNKKEAKPDEGNGNRGERTKRQETTPQPETPETPEKHRPGPRTHETAGQVGRTTS